MALLNDIKALAKTDPEFATLIASKDTQAVARVLSVGRVALKERLAGIGTILVTLGAVEGPALLDALVAATESNRLVYWAWKLIESGQLDLGQPLTRAQIDVFVALGVISAGGGAALKALAEYPTPITEYAVRVALYADDGTYLG